MFKKTVTSLVAGAGLLAMVGAASAADININLYGASAQYKFWNAAAAPFLTSKGCSDVVAAENADKKHGITKGTLGTDTIYIRYSAKASFDGVYSCKGEVPPPGETPDSCIASNGARYRSMADVVDWPTHLVTALGCKEVTIGASDVAGGSFGQQSKGKVKGCNVTGSVITRNIPTIDTSSLATYYRPIVVPFGFFANTALTGVDNLTRLQALMLFSGKALTWDQFGSAYPAKDTVICLRHAGSGTHATLAAAVMRKDQPIVKEEDCPYISFNDGSSDMMKCINTNDGVAVADAAAVGYADADALAGSGAALYPSVKPLNYEGAAPTRTNIQNGVYSFWSHQWLYECAPGNTTTHPWVQQLAAYAGVDANLVALGLGDFWAADSSMNVDKTTDFSMPTF
jgi:hypothetical protein